MVVNTDGGWKITVQLAQASDVSIVGPFNNWNTTATPMKRKSDGVWEANGEGSVPERTCLFVLNSLGRLSYLVPLIQGEPAFPDAG